MTEHIHHLQARHIRCKLLRIYQEQSTTIHSPDMDGAVAQPRLWKIPPASDDRVSMFSRSSAPESDGDVTRWMNRGLDAHRDERAFACMGMRVRAWIDKDWRNSSSFRMDAKLRPYLTYLLLQLDLPKFLDIVREPFICSLLRFQQETPNGDHWFVDTPLEGLPLTLEELYEACRSYDETDTSTSTNTADKSLRKRTLRNEIAAPHSEQEIPSLETGPRITHDSASNPIRLANAHCSRGGKSQRSLEITPMSESRSNRGAARWGKRSRTTHRHAPSPAARRAAATSSPWVPPRARGCIRRDWLRAWERVRRRRSGSKAREP